MAAGIDKAARERSTLRVWLLTDDKPGHRNQLAGLASRLQALVDAEICWLHSEQYPLPWWRLPLGLPAALAQRPAPDMVIAAGSGSHRLLLACHWHLPALTVVLMRAGFPRRWADLHIIPQHDTPPDRPEVLATRGVLNDVQPKAVAVSEKQGLILIGGPSKHYHWDDQQILAQLQTLFAENPDWQWTLTSSRRTPASLITALTALQCQRIRYYHHQQTTADWLPAQLQAARVVWVSPDSVSMLYEALTSGTATGMLTLTARGRGRVVNGIGQLCAEGVLATMAERQTLMAATGHQPAGLWEADRAARWLLDHYKAKQA